MSFASPLGLLALLAVPVVLALHLYRRRLSQRPVAGLFLWASTAPRADAGRRRTRIQHRATLWLELAAAILLALWLSGLRLGVAGSIPHVVIVVDDSASMAAVGSQGGSAADAARRVAAGLAEALPRDGVATVVRSGPRPEVLCGPRAPGIEVAPSLARWSPSAAAHDLAPAIDLALELGGSDADLVLLTDRAARGVPERFRVEAFGVAAPNAAVIAARRALGSDGRETVYCDVAAWGRALEGRLLVESADGTVRAEASARVEPDRPRHLAIELPAEDGPLVARIAVGDDALGLDDTCPMPAAPDRTVTVASTLEPATTARLALRRVADALDGVVLTEDPAAAHLRFAAAPGALRPGHHEVVVAAVGDDGDRDAWVGPFLVDRRSGLAEGLTLEGVVWTAGRGRLPGDPLVLADARALAAAEVLVGDALRLHLNLDLGRSNLTSSPDWPILLANLAEHVRARLPGVVDVVVPVGGIVRYRGDTDGLALVDADRVVRPSRGVGLATWEARVPGLARIERAGEPVALVGVHFVDPNESDLTVRDAFARPATATETAATASGAISAPGRLEARALALLLLGILLADWWVLRARAGAR